MKAKLLKRLRKKYTPEIVHPSMIKLLNKYPRVKKVMWHKDIIADITHNRLWYKLLITLTHK